MSTKNEERLKANLEALSKIYPEIKNVPENLGVGYWLIHTQTTPVIEVAGDGKTAKGIWYSPGFGFSTLARDGEVEIGGYWYWEKYGVDFIKEDGEWRIWHLQTYYDLMPKYGSDWTKPEPQPSKSDDAYKPWSPTTVPRIEPRFPKPYYTFSETFSY